MQFNTLFAEFEHIRNQNPDKVLLAEDCVTYAEHHKDSLIRKQFPTDKELIRSAKMQIVGSLIRVHYTVMPAFNAEPIRVWVSESTGHNAHAWSPTVEVLDDAERRRILVLREISRMLGIYGSYKLEELSGVAKMLNKLRAHFEPSVAEAAE